MSGSTANFNGAKFEQQVARDMMEQIPGLIVVDYKEIKKNFQVHEVRSYFKGQNILIKNMKRVRSAQKAKVATLEFYYCRTDTFIECKFQEVTGTASQKIPFSMIDGYFNGADGANTIFILGGSKLTNGLQEPYYDFVCSRDEKLRYIYPICEAKTPAFMPGMKRA